MFQANKLLMFVPDRLQASGVAHLIRLSVEKSNFNFFNSHSFHSQVVFRSLGKEKNKQGEFEF